jgi:hypothetical protein
MAELCSPYWVFYLSPDFVLLGAPSLPLSPWELATIDEGNFLCPSPGANPRQRGLRARLCVIAAGCGAAW